MMIYKQTDKAGFVRYYIEEMPSWDDFPAIVSAVLGALDSAIVRQGDGPDARFCILTVEGHEVVFTHNDMLGNCFYSRDEKAYDVLQKIQEMFKGPTDE